jgi:hypothetical protein
MQGILALVQAWRDAFLATWKTCGPLVVLASQNAQPASSLALWLGCAGHNWLRYRGCASRRRVAVDQLASGTFLCAGSKSVYCYSPTVFVPVYSSVPCDGINAAFPEPAAAMSAWFTRTETGEVSGGFPLLSVHLRLYDQST